MEVLIILGVFGLIVGVIAQGKGRSFFPWFLYGALLFIVAIIHVGVIKSTVGKVCPECRSNVDTEATICKFCKHQFTKEEFKVLAEKKKEEEKYNGRMGLVLIVIIIIAFVLFKIAFTGGL